MKQLWTMRWSDGRLMKWDGTGWATQGTYAPLDWPSDTNDRRKYRLGSCFVYRGQLFTRWVCWNESQPGGTYMAFRIGLYNPSTGDVTAQCSLTAPYQYGREMWGNVFEYKGVIYWFATTKGESDGNNDNRLVLYKFYYNGSTPTLTRRLCTEMGSLGLIYTGRTEWNSHTHVPFISADHDRMYMGPGGGALMYSQNGVKMHTLTTGGAFDIDASDNVSLQQFGFNNASYLDYAPNDAAAQNSRPIFSDVDSMLIATTVFKSKCYGVSYTGKLFEIIPGTNTRTQKLDISLDLPVTGLGGATTFTTDAQSTGDTDQNLRWANGASSGAYGFPWAYWGGMRLKVLNYGGTPSNVKWGLTEKADGSGGSNYNITGYDDSGTRFNGQPTGTQFQAYWMMYHAHYNSSDYTTKFVQMFTYNNKLWILGLSGRSQSNAPFSGMAVTAGPPWHLTSWDGTSSTGTTSTYRNDGTFFDAVGHYAVTLDESAGLLHVLFHDHQQQAVKHATFDLTQSTPTLTLRGTIYTKANDSGEVNYAGFPVDAMAVFDPYDITVTTGTRTLNTSAGTITVPYSLWSQNTNADTCTIKIEYNTGSGWFDCTQKSGQGEGKTSLSASSTGAAHTFVHDAFADLGTFAGSIQHRISVVSQTRN